MSKMKVRFDDKKITLTEEYINALKQLMLAEIQMMKIKDRRNAKYWHCGSANIGDLSKGNAIFFLYGSKEDKKEIQASGQIFVEVSPTKETGRGEIED